MTRVCIDVCPACYQGRGPLPLGLRTVCRTENCFYFDEVRPSYQATPSRLVPSVGLDLDLLVELEDFLEDREDISDGSHGWPVPNKAMSLLRDIREAMAKAAPPPRPMSELVERRFRVGDADASPQGSDVRRQAESTPQRGPLHPIAGLSHGQPLASAAPTTSPAPESSEPLPKPAPDAGGSAPYWSLAQELMRHQHVCKRCGGMDATVETLIVSQGNCSRCGRLEALYRCPARPLPSIPQIERQG